MLAEKPHTLAVPFSTHHHSQSQHILGPIAYSSTRPLHPPCRDASIMPHHIPPDTKPRLTKEQHDVLETHFQSQHKPDTNTKKYLAASLHVQIEKVNVSLPDYSLRPDVAESARIGFRIVVQSRSKMPASRPN